MGKRKTAIMQPYFFPSISYFRLVNAVDLFIFLDDAYYIKKGWINRNKILLDGQSHNININCKSLSQNKRINEIKIDFNKIEISKKLKTLHQAYKNAPYFKDVYPLLEKSFLFDTEYLSTYSSNTIIQTLKFLGIEKDFKFSSVDFKNTSDLKGQERIIDICKKSNTAIYINAEGGKKLYDKERFDREKIKLNYIESKYPKYTQFENEFVEMLSFIDVLMFNNRKVISDYLNEYNLN